MFPVSAFADITEIARDPKHFIAYELTDDEYVVSIPAGKTGTFTLKTKSGASKFVVPGEVYSLTLTDWASHVTGTDHKIEITFGDGSVFTHDRLTNSSSIVLDHNYFDGRKVKGFTVKVTINRASNYNSKLFLKGLSIKIGTGSFDPDPGSGTDPGKDPDPDPGEGQDPGGGDPGNPGGGPGTDPGTDPGGGSGPDPGSGSGCLCQAVCEILPDILVSFGDSLSDLNGRMKKVHDVLNDILDATDRLHDDNLRLEDVLDEIENDVAPLHGDLRVIQDQLDEVLHQITPRRSYNVPNNVSVPDYYDPGEATPYYQNRNTYFTDQGDVAVPDAMPAAPEPVPWAFEGKTLNQDAEISKSPLQQRDVEMEKEPDLQKGEDMQKDSEMSRDQEQERSPDMEKEQDLERDIDLERSPELEMSDYLEVQDKQYPLRWKSTDYVR